MKIIVAGCGKLGDAIIDFLTKEDHDITLIDNNAKVLEDAVSRHDIMGIVGNCASYEVQQEAEVDKADIIVAATASDELNILACMIAKKLGSKYAFARVRTPEYSSQILFMRENFGLDLVFNPERDAAREISKIIQFPSALRTEGFAKGRVDLVEFAVPEGCTLAGKKLSSLPKVCKAKVLVCAVQRDGEVFIPSGDFVIEAGDVINISAPHDQIYNFFKEISALKKKIKSVLIVGGGKIGYYLAQMLAPLNIQIKIIESSEERCRELSALLPKATVISSDGSDLQNLTEEGLPDVDACVSLTGVDEENLIISMIASSYDVRKVIAKVTRFGFLKLLPEIGINCSLISPENITASHILRYVRGIQNSEGSNVETLYKIIDNGAEAMQFIVKNNFEHTDIELKDLKLKKNLLVASIIRGNEIIHPDGRTVIKSGDRVIIVTTIEGLRDLNDIME